MWGIGRRLGTVIATSHATLVLQSPNGVNRPDAQNQFLTNIKQCCS